MPSPFAITVTTNSVSLDNNRQGHISFTVSNTTPRVIYGRGRLVAEPVTAGPWLTLRGEAERKFVSNESKQYIVQITVPPYVPSGEYTFRLNMVNLDNPDDSYIEGPTVKFIVVMPAVVKKPFPWWIVAVMMGLLILVGGGTYGIIRALHPPLQWQSIAHMLNARYFFAAVLGSDGRIYAIGGSNSGSVLNTVEAYDPKVESWTVVAPMPTARSGFAAVRGKDGRIYAIGGSNNTANALTTVEAYDPKTDSWTTIAPMLTPRFGLTAVLGPDGLIYAIGGSNSDGVLNTVEAYDPKTNTWKAVAPMPTARSDLAAVLGPDGRIYAIGGAIASLAKGRVLNTVEAYDPKTNTWKAVAPMPTARSDLAAVLGSDGRIYAIGGSNSGGVLNTVEAYDPKVESWTVVAPMPTARSDLAAVLGPDGRIYAIGGANGTALNTVEAYDTQKEGMNTVRVVALLPQYRQVPPYIPYTTGVSPLLDTSVPSASRRYSGKGLLILY